MLAGAAVLLAISLWPSITPPAAFALALLAISGAVVVAYSAAGNYLVPLPHRYIQEFNVGTRSGHRMLALRVPGIGAGRWSCWCWP